MAPSAGLTITKLGFYGTTDWETGTVKGLLCLKVGWESMAETAL